MSTTATITINGLVWQVFFVEKGHSELADDNGGQPAYGIALFRKCNIFIDRGLPRQLLKQTLTHELVHAIAFSYGTNIDLENEEKICDFIAAHFDELKTLRKTILKSF